MKQGQLFVYKATHTKNDIQEKGETPWYEDTVCKNLEFIAVPYAMMLGVQSLKRGPIEYSHQKKMLFANELLKPINTKEGVDIAFQVATYLEQESKWLRKDWSKRIRGDNRMHPEEFLDILAAGAIELSRRHRSLRVFKLLLRKKLPKCPYRLKFSRLGRYILNGSADEFWYRDTGKEIMDLFAGFKPELISSLLAITSIRSTVSTNAVKFFKALQQFYAEKVHTVLIGERGNKQQIKSSFQGFLDASLIHLNKLKGGEALIDSEQKNARKIRMFASAMLEGVEAIVADIWIMRSFGCDLKYFYEGNLVSRSPTRALYDAIEWYFQVLGNYLGKEPRGVCSMVWSGIRSETTTSSTRYSETLKQRLDHGIFAAQYGALILTKDGIKFEEL